MSVVLAVQPLDCAVCTSSRPSPRPYSVSIITFLSDLLWMVKGQPRIFRALSRCGSPVTALANHLSHCCSPKKLWPYKTSVPPSLHPDHIQLHTLPIQLLRSTPHTADTTAHRNHHHHLPSSQPAHIHHPHRGAAPPAIYSLTQSFPSKRLTLSLFPSTSTDAHYFTFGSFDIVITTMVSETPKRTSHKAAATPKDNDKLTEREIEILSKAWTCMRNQPEV